MEQKIVYIPLDHLAPHPKNPRKDLGDLSELTESIKAKGVLQNLTVVPFGPDSYTVLIGHRRAAAAKLAGLTELPCVIVEMSREDQLATMLMENMQRSDLTIYEQAKGFQMMLDLGKTVTEVSEISGFSEATVRRRAKLAELDEKKFKKAVDRGATLYDFAELDKIEDPEVKNKLLGSIGTQNYRNELEAAINVQTWKKRFEELAVQVSGYAQKVDDLTWKGSHRVGICGSEEVELDYFQNYNQYNAKAKKMFIPDANDENEYYYDVTKNEITLYKKHRTDPEEAEAERARRESADKHAKLKATFEEITERHRKLRLDFVKSFNQYDRKDTTVWEFITEAMIYAKRNGGGYYNNHNGLEELASMLNVSMTDTSPPALAYSEFLSEKLKHPQRTALLTAMWVLDRGSYWREWFDPSAQRYRVIYQDNDNLDMVYRLLSQLGYLQSTEEQELRKGTHKLIYNPERADE